MADARVDTSVRLLLFVLGFWLCLSFAMGYVASANFRVVEPDDLRLSDEVYASIEAGDDRRMALRYVASEINRDLFAGYDKLNLALAAVALLLATSVRPRPRWIVPVLVLNLATALTFTFWFTPTLLELGREIDFLPRDPRPEPVERFYSIHGVNISLELLKMALIAAVAGVLIRGPRGERSTPAAAPT